MVLATRVSARNFSVDVRNKIERSDRRISWNRVVTTLLRSGRESQTLQVEQTIDQLSR